MTRRNEGEGGQEIHVRAVKGTDSPVLNQVVALGDRASKTVGFLPASVFEQAAHDGKLLVALEGERVIGYAYFSLPRQEVRLVHLCVDPPMQRRGVARRLIQELSNRYQDREGIVLKCREDYPANNMWPKLGFYQIRTVRGRGLIPSTLVVWFRDHGLPNLFSARETDAPLRVALDLNVFLDLHSAQPRPGARESKALIADWLAGQVELEIVPELIREINSMTSGSERERQLVAARRYHLLPVSASTAEKLAHRLIDHLREHAGVDLALDQSDRSDVQHIAEAATAGLRYFVTRDEGLINRVSDAAVKVCGLRILRPADVIVHLDELTRAQLYRPAELLHTEYALAAVGSGREQEMLAFVDEAGGERKPEFLRRMREIAATTPRWERRVIRDPGGAAVAVYRHRRGGGLRAVMPAAGARRAPAGGHDLAPSPTPRRSSRSAILGNPHGASWPGGGPGRGGIAHRSTPRHGLGPTGTAAAHKALAGEAARPPSRPPAPRRSAARPAPRRGDPVRASSARRPLLILAAVPYPRAAGGWQLPALGADPEAGATADLVLTGVQHHQKQPGHRVHLPGVALGCQGTAP